MPDISPSLLLKELSHAIRETKSERRKVRLQSELENLKVLVKTWRDAGECYYPGCSSKSIEHSHTVQRAALAKRLGNQVRTPVWGGEAFAIQRRSAKSLSTFPGYCPQHEGIFTFENTGVFSDRRDDVLQMMRTIHREQWLNDKKIEFLGRCNRATEADEDGRAPGLDATSESRNNMVRTLESMKIRIDALERVLSDSIANGTSIPQGLVIGADIDLLPFSFHAAVELNETLRPLIAVSLVFAGGQSRVITAIEPDFEECNVAYWSQFLATDSKRLKTFDEWIKFGTFDWYASEQWWASKSKDEQSKLEGYVNKV